MRTLISNIECIVENPGQSNTVVLFHGYGADFSDLVSLADFMDPEGHWTWIFPNGPISVDIGYAMTGRAWFPIAVADLQQAMMTGKAKDYANSQPEGLTAVLKELHLFAQEIKSQYKGVVVGGFSQGGMVASHLFSEFNESLRGAVLMSTVLLNREKLTKNLEGVKPIPFLQSHGSKDQVLPVQQGMDLYQFLKKSGWQGKWQEFSGGHEIPQIVLSKAQEFLKSLNPSKEI